MTKKTFVSDVQLVLGICLVVALFFCQIPPANASPRGGPGYQHQTPTANASPRGWSGYNYGDEFHHYQLGYHHEDGYHRYHHYYGHGFYEPDPFFFDFFAAALTIGTIIALLPDGYQTIVVGGAPYYYYDNVYYQTCPSGYVVVPAPVLPDGTVTVNILNPDGSYTAVKLVKHGDGYTGPQGEYYPGHPTVEQLKALYGEVAGNIQNKAAKEAANRNATVKYDRTTEQGWKEEIVATPSGQQGDYKLIDVKYFRNGKVVKEEVKQVPIEQQP